MSNIATTVTTPNMRMRAAALRKTELSLHYVAFSGEAFEGTIRLGFQVGNAGHVGQAARPPSQATWNHMGFHSALFSCILTRGANVDGSHTSETEETLRYQCAVSRYAHYSFLACVASDSSGQEVSAETSHGFALPDFKSMSMNTLQAIAMHERHLRTWLEAFACRVLRGFTRHSTCDTAKAKGLVVAWSNDRFSEDIWMLRSLSMDRIQRSCWRGPDGRFQPRRKGVVGRFFRLCTPGSADSAPGARYARCRGRTEKSQQPRRFAEHIEHTGRKPSPPDHVDSDSLF